MRERYLNVLDSLRFSVSQCIIVRAHTTLSPAWAAITRQEPRSVALSKQLRLEVAELTDVGRRRDSNEDNMTRLVPKDLKLLEQKGAIFVVADGMGGHAAGEVASEIAVETIREEYYESASEEVAEALLHAIRQANQVIYERATEQAGRAGMGTTCVVIVARGALAYIANVGDSRAYLIRDGQLRQVTHDHSWVAEQVRAGMLTDEQARTHAHRNVITRALGTQPEVEADLFIEQLQDGDLLLLCSDGLSGPVPDSELHRIVTSVSPQEAVHDLIAQANEQGGPDNITAVLIHVLEAPPLAPEMQERLALMIEAVKEQTAPNKPVKKQARRRLSPIAFALRIFMVAAVLFLSLAAWDYFLGPLAWTRAAHTQATADLGRVPQLVAQSQAQSPDQAINTLAAAQHPLLNDLHNSWLSGDDRQRITTTLQHVLAPAIRTALQDYNLLARVTPLGTLQTQRIAVSCSAVQELSQVVAVVPPAVSGQSGPASGGPPLFFARAQSQQMAAAPVYALPAQGTAQSSIACGATLDPAVVDLTVDGSTLYLLHQEGTTFSVRQVTITSDGKVQPPQTVVTLPPGAANMQPILLAVHGSQTYILYRGIKNDALESCADAVTADCKQVGPAVLSQQVRSMAIGPNGALYLLLLDGSLATLSGNSLRAVTIAVLPVLPVGTPDAFNVMTALPTLPVASSLPISTATSTLAPTGTGTPVSSTTPTAGTTVLPLGTKLTSATMLVSDQQNHLFIGDGADHRVIQLNPPATATGDPTLGAQYSDPSALDSLLSLSITNTVANGSQGTSLYALSGHSLLVVSLT